MTSTHTAEYKTLHQRLLADLCKRIPDVRTEGFRKEMRKAMFNRLMAEDDDCEDSTALANDIASSIPSILPDAYLIDVSGAWPRLTIFEVVVSSDLSSAKLLSILDMWDALDGYSWLVDMAIIDKSGKVRYWIYDPVFGVLSSNVRHAKYMTPKLDVNFILHAHHLHACNAADVTQPALDLLLS